MKNFVRLLRVMDPTDGGVTRQCNEIQLKYDFNIASKKSKIEVRYDKNHTGSFPLVFVSSVQASNKKSIDIGGDVPIDVMIHCSNGFGSTEVMAIAKGDNTPTLNKKKMDRLSKDHEELANRITGIVKNDAEALKRLAILITEVHKYHKSKPELPFSYLTKTDGQSMSLIPVTSDSVANLLYFFGIKSTDKTSALEENPSGFFIKVEKDVIIEGLKLNISQDLRQNTTYHMSEGLYNTLIEDVMILYEYVQNKYECKLTPHILTLGASDPLIELEIPVCITWSTVAE